MDANNQCRERERAGMFEKILLPTDFSGYSEKTVEFVAKIPGVTEVILVHIREKERPDNPAWMSGPERESALERVQRLLQKNRIYLEERSIEVRDVVMDADEDDIATCILDSAKKKEWN
jgi:Universal stress protein family.